MNSKTKKIVAVVVSVVGVVVISVVAGLQNGWILQGRLENIMVVKRVAVPSNMEEIIRRPGRTALNLHLASTPGIHTVVKGSSNVKFVGLSFACSARTYCKVTDLTLTGYLDDNGNASAFSSTGTGSDNSTLLNSYVGSVYLEDSTGSVIATSQSVQNDGSVTFTDMNWIISAGNTVTAYVVGDISDNAFANGDSENIGFGITSTANVTAEDGAGNNISNIIGTPNNTPSTYITTTEE